MAIKAEFLQAALKARASRPPQARHRVASRTLHGLTFSAAFDGGNLARVEASGPDEFVLHARADCEGTPHATRSRTWFCFSVQGAAPGRTLNIDMRMSNQLKLFEHGMRPCYRALPSRPEWARLPVATPCAVDGATTDSFAIHITHTVDTPADDTLFFAFCFPLGYSDLMGRLAWTDALFRQPSASLSPSPPPAGWVKAVELLTAAAAISEQQKAPEAGSSALSAAAPAGTSTIPAPVSAEQMRQFRYAKLVTAAKQAALAASVAMCEAGGGCEIAISERPADAAAARAVGHHHAAIADAAASSAAAMLPAERADSDAPGGAIYYRRELLTRSLEGRRIDLITISGSDSQMSTVEAALPPPLLPEGGPRPCRFKQKRYVFITGRVHPGETPASHVIDGLLSFLLRAEDPRAIALRQRYTLRWP